MPSQGISTGNPANTGVAGNKKPRPRTAEASCLVVRSSLETNSLSGRVSTAEGKSGNVRRAIIEKRHPAPYRRQDLQHLQCQPDADADAEDGPSFVWLCRLASSRAYEHWRGLVGNDPEIPESWAYTVSRKRREAVDSPQAPWITYSAIRQRHPETKPMRPPGAQ